MIGFLDLTQFQETDGKMLINEMLLVWSKGDQSHIESRQEPARIETTRVRYEV